MTNPIPVYRPMFPGQVVPVVPLLEPPAAAKKASSKKQARAHDADGQFSADDPATPDVNEAWIAEGAGNPEA